MERPDQPHEGSAPDIFVSGSANDYLVTGLRDPDPEVRARFAEAIGLFRAYLTLPYLLDAVVADPDVRVRDAARRAAWALVPPAEAPAPGVTERVSQPRNARPSGAPLKESEAVFALFNAYVAQRMNLAGGPTQADLIAPVTSCLEAWGGNPVDDLGEIERAAQAAVKSIDSFLRIPNESAGVKYLSFQAAKKRVEEYEALTAGHDEKEA